MSQFYPRAAKSRTDALIGTDHVFDYSPRNERSRRDALARNIGPGIGGLTMAVAQTGANSIAVKSIISGGINAVFTVSGQDLWRVFDTNIASTVAAGLATGFNASSLVGVLVSSGTAPFSLDATRTILNVKLPPIAAYSPGTGTAFAWSFPEVAFENRAGALSVASALVVTSA